MQEFEQKILEQYDIEVNSTRKVRGAVLCETNKGVFLLKEVTTSEKESLRYANFIHGFMNKERIRSII